MEGSGASRMLKRRVAGGQSQILYMAIIFDAEPIVLAMCCVTLSIKETRKPDTEDTETVINVTGQSDSTTAPCHSKLKKPPYTKSRELHGASPALASVIYIYIF